MMLYSPSTEIDPKPFSLEENKNITSTDAGLYSCLSMMNVKTHRRGAEGAEDA
jgi:hypothetical protein